MVHAAVAAGAIGRVRCAFSLHHTQGCMSNRACPTHVVSPSLAEQPGGRHLHESEEPVGVEAVPAEVNGRDVRVARHHL